MQRLSRRSRLAHKTTVYGENFPSKPIQTLSKSSISCLLPSEPLHILEVDQIWSHSPLDDVFNTVGDITLHYRDMQTLKPGNWLNDEVINAYCNLIAGNTSEVVLMNSFFLPILQQTPLISLTKIHKIIRRKGVESIFDRQKVVIPVNIRSAHWAIYCIDHNTETITNYDSLDWEDASISEVISRYISLEFEDLGTFTRKEYGRVKANAGVQVGTDDCGVFALLNARNCCFEGKIEVEQALIPMYRRLITLELKKGRFLQ